MEKKIDSKKVFMKPGKNNREDRLNFVKFWADYIKTHNDEEWSKQQKMLIDSQINNSKQFHEELSKTKEGRETIKRLKEFQVEKA